MPIRRYSGELRIYVTLPESTPDYTVRVCRNGAFLGLTTVRNPPAERRCEDDPTVIDEVAHAGLSFLDADGVDLSSADQSVYHWHVSRVPPGHPRYDPTS